MFDSKFDNYNTIDKEDDNIIISSEKTEETKNEKTLLLKTSCTEIGSNLSQSLQIKSAVESESKIDTVQPELLNNAHNLSSIDSVKNPPQLLSEQYINVFKRYQVL